MSRVAREVGTSGYLFRNEKRLPRDNLRGATWAAELDPAYPSESGYIQYRPAALAIRQSVLGCEASGCVQPCCKLLRRLVRRMKGYCVAILFVLVVSARAVTGGMSRFIRDLAMRREGDRHFSA